MKIRMYQVDAFTDKLFGGNPAAVCLPDKPLSEQLMQAIAAENNLAETAFVLPEGNDFSIRWFTPVAEVDLCGHATLASAHAIFSYCHYGRDEINFNSRRSGLLKVTKHGDELILNFPSDEIKMIEAPAELVRGLSAQPLETYMGKTDIMAVLPSQTAVEQLMPDFAALSSLSCRGIIVTATGDGIDFVSRFFAPQVGVNEDPVTGSAHTTLIPYWAKVLDKTDMNAVQLSQRRGYLRCRYLGDRVEIAGKAVTYLAGEIEIMA